MFVHAFSHALYLHYTLFMSFTFTSQDTWRSRLVALHSFIWWEVVLFCDVTHIAEGSCDWSTTQSADKHIDPDIQTSSQPPRLLVGVS